MRRGMDDVLAMPVPPADANAAPQSRRAEIAASAMAPPRLVSRHERTARQRIRQLPSRCRRTRRAADDRHGTHAAQGVHRQARCYRHWLRRAPLPKKMASPDRQPNASPLCRLPLDTAARTAAAGARLGRCGRSAARRRLGAAGYDRRGVRTSPGAFRAAAPRPISATNSLRGGSLAFHDTSDKFVTTNDAFFSANASFVPSPPAPRTDPNFRFVNGDRRQGRAVWQKSENYRQG